MTSSEEACISQQLLYRWDSIFDTPRIASDRYDEPFVNNVGDGETANPSIDVIRFFMQAFDGDDSCHFATDTVVDFCEGANLSNLQRNESATTQLVALLNDSGGMTARDLLEALAQSRRVRIDETNIKINRLYIEDLNRWTILALAASVPDHQAAIVGEFVYNHLEFDPLIKTKIIRSALPAFAFEFHLPYFAFRKHKLPQRDKRQFGNGKTLRQCHDITFLRTMDSKDDNSLNEYVYESQLSYLVSGLSRYSWSAYLFNDLYFELDDNSDSVAGYDAEREMEPGLDPLSTGKIFLSAAPCEPREYFLFIFEIRMRRIKKEWKQLYGAIDEAIRTYKSEYWTRTGHGVSSRLNTDRQRTQSREDLQEWIRRSTELLRKFITSLDQLIREWNGFRNTGINYFTSTVSPDHLTKLLNTITAIDQHVIDLGRLLPKFNHTMDCLSEDMLRDVNLLIAHESNESALFQQKTARDVKILTRITFLTLPFALAASLLSTQEGFIPITPSPWAFVASIAILETLVWLILGTLLGWDWFKGKLMWVRHHFGLRREGIEDIELRQLEGLR
ncbi:hypothetical protein F4821DRAFT_262891 [Hypoxylon rubiginosum]|uniref:Uncharacterized protein n=1 Tax=Hypoxylon rubiginosum TaxID=110542 RepID=A0ACC0CSY4_9PEZI|nr:hypothetical protein F4821DRAFT_262891 [Hypoxylon rubiginosum]